MNKYVFDAWALLALLQREEPAATVVRDLLGDTLDSNTAISVSIINLGEVYYRIGRISGNREAQATYDDLLLLPIEVVSATDDRVLGAARLKMRHRVSYADAFALGLAQELGASLVTGDPELQALGSAVSIVPLTRHNAK